MQDMEYLKTIRFGHTDGTHISQTQFWSEHTDLNLTAYQQRRIVANLEVQAQAFLSLNWRRKRSGLKLTGHNIAYQDAESGNWYLLPLYQLEIRAFFLETNEPYLLIYDIRRVA